MSARGSCVKPSSAIFSYSAPSKRLGAAPASTPLYIIKPSICSHSSTPLLLHIHRQFNLKPTSTSISNMDLLTPDSPEHFQGSSPSPPKRLRLSTPEGVGNDRSAPIIVDGDSTTSVEPAPSQESAYEALSSGCQTPASNKESAQCTHLKEGSESLLVPLKKY